MDDYDIPDEPETGQTFDNPAYENPILDHTTLPTAEQYDPRQGTTENQRISITLQSYYKSQGYDEIPDGVDFSRFRVENGHLKFKRSDGEWTYLTNKTNPSKFVTPRTAGLKSADMQFLKLNARASLSENIEMTVIRSNQLATQETAITESSVDGATTEIEHNLDQVSEIANNLGLTEREVRGLDEAAQTLKGNIKIQTSKLLSIERQIDRETDPGELERLKGEKQAIIDSLNILRDQSNSQIESIKETVRKIKDGRLTIWERIKLIFKEQGLTIGAIITSIGLLIGLIVEATKTIAAGGGGGGGGGGQSDNFVKRGLKNLASALKKLAAKALEALPGLIGTIVSFLLKSGAAVVSFFAEHLWALGLAAGAIIYDVFVNNTRIGREIETKRKGK